LARGEKSGEPIPPRIRQLAAAGSDLEQSGGSFFDAVFEPTRVRPMHNLALGRVRPTPLDPDCGLRIQLRYLASGPEKDPPLRGVPWEYLYDPALPGGFLAVSEPRLSLVRSLARGTRSEETYIEYPVRLLTVLANPAAGPNPIDTAEERRLIEMTLGGAGLNSFVGDPREPRANAAGWRSSSPTSTRCATPAAGRAAPPGRG
jgi:hypothetical protein